MSDLPVEYPASVRILREGDTVSFDIEQTTVAFPTTESLTKTISGPVLMVTRGMRPYPNEVCLSLPQGNFWFDKSTHIIYAGKASSEELDYRQTETYGEGYPR